MAALCCKGVGTLPVCAGDRSTPRTAARLGWWPTERRNVRYREEG